MSSFFGGSAKSQSNVPKGPPPAVFTHNTYKLEGDTINNFTTIITTTITTTSNFLIIILLTNTSFNYYHHYYY